MFNREGCNYGGVCQWQNILCVIDENVGKSVTRIVNSICKWLNDK